MSAEKSRVVDELHKPARVKFPRRKTVLKGIDDVWQSDLIQLDNYAKLNRGYKYILVVIDCFSKYLWMRPLKNKTGEEVARALGLILRDGVRKPKNLQTDAGKEYYNKYFMRLMADYNINHYSTYSVTKASIAERVIRTIKQKLYKLFSLHGKHVWYNLLNKVTEEYNNSKHRTIGRAPSAVNSKAVERQLLNTVYNNIKVFGRGKFQVGDSVRISKYKHVFRKGYLPNWTTELFKINKIQITNPITYLLEDEKGSPIRGAFYEHELQKTKLPDVYLIDKVLKRRGDMVYVSWLGLNSSHNSWIPKTSFV